jgi:hypothetical protein
MKLYTDHYVRNAICWAIGTIVCIIVIMFVIGYSSFLFVSYTSEQSCYAQTADIGLPARWSFLGNCQVYSNNNWIPLSNYMYIETVERHGYPNPKPDNH